MAARAEDPWYRAALNNLGTSYRQQDNPIYEILWQRGLSQGLQNGILITRDNVAAEIRVQQQAAAGLIPVAPAVAPATGPLVAPAPAVVAPALVAPAVALNPSFSPALIQLMQDFQAQSALLNIFGTNLDYVLDNPQIYFPTPAIQTLVQLRTSIIQLFQLYLLSKQNYFSQRAASGLLHMNASPRKLIVMLVGHGGMSHQNIRIPEHITFTSYNPPSLFSILLPNHMYWNQGGLGTPTAYNNGDIDQYSQGYQMSPRRYRIVPNITFCAANPGPDPLNFSPGNVVKQLDAAGIYIFYQGDNEFEFIPHANAVVRAGGNTLQQLVLFLNQYIQTHYGKPSFELVSLLCQSIYSSEDVSLTSIFQVFSDLYDFGPFVFYRGTKQRIIDIFSEFISNNIEMKSDDAREIKQRLNGIMSRDELIRFLQYLQTTFQSLLTLNQYLETRYTLGGIQWQLLSMQGRKISTMLQIVYNLLSDPSLGKKRRTRNKRNTRTIKSGKK